MKKEQEKGMKKMGGRGKVKGSSKEVVKVKEGMKRKDEGDE
jgi:hypothetical protein